MIKRFLLLPMGLILCKCILLIIGCGGELQDLNTYDNPEPFNVIDTNSIWVEHGNQVEGGECYQVLHVPVYGRAPSGGLYYAVGLYQRGELLELSEKRFIVDSFQTEFSILVGDFANVYDGEYQLGISGSDTYYIAGVGKARSTTADFIPWELIGLAMSNCANLCDDVYSYANIIGLDPDIVASYCAMNVKYPNKLCGDYLCDTGQAHSVVLSIISYDTIFTDVKGDTYDNTWTTMGYGAKRYGIYLKGDTIANYVRICECQGNDWFVVIDSINYPDTSATAPLTHKYYQILNENVGRWEYRYDNDSIETSFSSSRDDMWLNLKGTKYAFGAEIKGLKTDMVGTSSDPCIITDCAYHVSKSGGWEYRQTNFALRTIEYWLKSDTTEWMIKAIDSNTVHIWDVNPR